MDKTHIPFLSVAELSSLIRRKEVSPVEATEAYLQRIDELNGTLNAYVTVCREQALEAAKQAEQAIVRGEYHGPLHGVPVAVKDQFYTRGIRTTGGSAILADFVPDRDATVVSKLNDAGAVNLGKLNMSEFARGDAYRHPFGVPRNPWDLERGAGVSSSGSAVATAAFLCATSVAEDTGGSIRGPAAFCGVVGLRPSYGRVSRNGMMSAIWSMDAGGPISRTVEDCAITLEAMAGHDPEDPYTWDSPVPNYSKTLTGDIRGIRVGVLRDRIESDVVEPDVRDGVLKAVAQLEEMGAVLEDVSLPLMADSWVIFDPIYQVEGATVHWPRIKEWLKEYDHNLRVRQLVGALVPAQAYYKAQKLRAIFRREMLEALDKVDVLVLPASSVPAWKLGPRPTISGPADLSALYYGRRSYTAPAPLAGVPAISVPCGFTASEPELPIGLQIMGRPFDEGMVLRVAHAYEQSTSWHTRRPPNIGTPAA